MVAYQQDEHGMAAAIRDISPPPAQPFISQFPHTFS
jgi:hypothetical protein